MLATKDGVRAASLRTFTSTVRVAGSSHSSAGAVAVAVGFSAIAVMWVVLLVSSTRGEGAVGLCQLLPSPPLFFCCWHAVLYGADGGASSRQGKVPGIFVRK